MLAAMLCVAFAGCGGPTTAADITAFEPSAEALPGGSSTTASAQVKNTGAEGRGFWIGYSVQDPNGEWHDAPPSEIELQPGEESGTRELSTEPLETTGYYKARVSVWDAGPESGAERARLADREVESAFKIYQEREDFEGSELDNATWSATDRELGRGDIVSENVYVEDGQLRLALPADTLDGGELQSTELYGPGFYAARIKVPDVPSSITGFFLYQPPDYESEIDVEIFNDPSGKVMFTTYADGAQTNTETLELPFDPTEDFHDYAFFYGKGSVTFYVDGVPMTTYEGGLPDKPMRLYVNAWFPDWLGGEESGSDGYINVDWIES